MSLKITPEANKPLPDDFDSEEPSAFVIHVGFDFGYKWIRLTFGFKIVKNPVAQLVNVTPTGRGMVEKEMLNLLMDTLNFTYIIL